MSRAPEIAFACPTCGSEAMAGLDGRGRCPKCGAEPALALSASIREQRLVDRCPACQGEQLYVQRDFNQRAGLARNPKHEAFDLHVAEQYGTKSP